MRKVEDSITETDWEKILRGYGLGVHPARTSDGTDDTQDSEISEGSDDSEPKDEQSLDISENGEVFGNDNQGLDDNETIRNAIGGDDPFFEGHQIYKPRQRIRTDENQLLDAWVDDYAEVQAFLLRRFKRCKNVCEFEKYGAISCLSRNFPEAALCKSCKQRQQAGRWAQIIQIYFRLGWSEADSAREIYGKTDKQSVHAIYRAVGNIRQARVKDVKKLNCPTARTDCSLTARHWATPSVRFNVYGLDISTRRAGNISPLPPRIWNNAENSKPVVPTDTI